MLESSSKVPLRLGHDDSRGGGGGPNPAPRASVALTAKQWSAVTLAASHGVESLKTNKRIPLAVISEALKDLGTALQEIQARLAAEALRRGEK